MKVTKTKELPLELSIRQDKGPDGQAFVYGKMKRGWLTRPILMRVNDDSLAPRLVPPKYNRAELERLCDQIRAELTAEGWPHDRTPYNELNVTALAGSMKLILTEEYDWWIVLIRESTEPLSRVQTAAEALYSFARMLELYGREFDTAYYGMISYFNYFVGKELNGLAVSGANSQKGLSAGPKTRTQNAARRQDKVAALAEVLWKACPHLRDRPNITARKIYPDVLRWLEEESPGSTPVSISTINKDVAAYLTKS